MIKLFISMMKSRFLLSLILSVSLVSTASSQSVYYFKYKFSATADTTTYHAFFVRYNDGSGFVRIRFDAPGTGELTLIETQLWQQEVEISPGVLDTTVMPFTASSPSKFIFGSSKTKYLAPWFEFRLDQDSKSFEPSAIIAKDEDVPAKATIIATRAYTAETLDKDIVSQFFSPGEDFFANTMEPSTRGLSDAEKKIKLRLIIVSNTNDPHIGKACGLDIQRVTLMFDSIRKFIGISMITTVISGKTYNKAAVVKVLKDLNPDPNDIVVFYYTGHGFRKTEDPRPFPYIDLRPKDDKTYMVNSLNILDVFNTIKGKPKAARLNIVLSDCCNTVPGKNKIDAKAIGGFRDIRDWSQDNCRQLFLNPTPTSVLITASDVGQFSSCDSTAGGLFTIFFKAALENNLTNFKKNVNWDQVAAETKNATSIKARHTYCDRPFIPANICAQDPIPKVVMGRGD